MSDPSPAPIVVVGLPTALGGNFGGMERTPGELRALDVIGRIRNRPGLAGAPIRDAGDTPNEPGAGSAGRRGRSLSRRQSRGTLLRTGA